LKATPAFIEYAAIDYRHSVLAASLRHTAAVAAAQSQHALRQLRDIAASHSIIRDFEPMPLPLII
jgi:hypothetical protein